MEAAEEPVNREEEETEDIVETQPDETDLAPAAAAAAVRLDKRGRPIKPQTEKQKVAFEKARKVRLENIRIRRYEKLMQDRMTERKSSNDQAQRVLQKLLAEDLASPQSPQNFLMAQNLKPQQKPKTAANDELPSLDSSSSSFPKKPGKAVVLASQAKPTSVQRNSEEQVTVAATPASSASPSPSSPPSSRESEPATLPNETARKSSSREPGSSKHQLPILLLSELEQPQRQLEEEEKTTVSSSSTPRKGESTTSTSPTARSKLAHSESSGDDDDEQILNHWLRRQVRKEKLRLMRKMIREQETMASDSEDEEADDEEEEEEEDAEEEEEEEEEEEPRHVKRKRTPTKPTRRVSFAPRTRVRSSSSLGTSSDRFAWL